MREKLQASGKVVDVDTDYQLGMPELRIMPGSRARGGPGRLHRDGGRHHQRAGGRRARGQVQRGRAAHRRARCGCWPISARGPRISRALKVRTAQRRRWCRCRRWCTQEERPALQAITRRDRERAISIFANVAPGSSQDEALAVVEQARQGAARRHPRGARRRERGVPRVHEQPDLRALPRASASRTWCSPRSSTRSCTR